MKDYYGRLNIEDINMDIDERDKRHDAVTTITLGELLRDDFDWGRDEWPA